MDTELCTETPITTVETVITTNEDLPSGHETEIDSEIIDTETFTQVVTYQWCVCMHTYQELFLWAP